MPVLLQREELYTGGKNKMDFVRTGKAILQQDKNKGLRVFLTGEAGVKILLLLILL
jgi:hypothetical protein